MSVAAIMLVKDEVDVIGQVIRHTKAQVDFILVADNRSTDGTRKVLDRAKVEVIDDDEVGYFQSRKMSHLADEARKRGAEWVVPVDGDELWYARNGRLGDVLMSFPPEVMLAQAVLFDHVLTGSQRAGNPLKLMAWRKPQPLPLTKVACRAREGLVIAPGNHSASYSDIWPAPAVLDAIVVHHFPYRSPEQFIRRVRNGAAAYAATDDSIPGDAGSHKRAFGAILEERGEGALREIFERDFWCADPEAAGLVRDPVIR